MDIYDNYLIRKAKGICYEKVAFEITDNPKNDRKYYLIICNMRKNKFLYVN